MFSLKRALYGMVGLWMLAMPATALAGPPSLVLVRHNHHGWYHRVCDEDGDDCRWVPNQRAHYQQQQQCDADGDDCRWVPSWSADEQEPQYQSDADGDDCDWTSGYGSPYYQEPYNAF
jgi:hypothetical protein